MAGTSGGSGFAWTQAVPWVLSLASLVWNYLNFRVTRAFKLQDREYDEWKIERDAVFQALRNFEDALDLLRPLQAGKHDLAALRDEITKANESIVTAHGKMTREIERAREMKPPRGAAYGLVIEGESAWDRLNSHLFEAGEINEADGMRNKIPSILSCGEEIRRSVEAICKHRPLK